MSQNETTTDLEELLKHSSWIRSLAYANLRDHALAEDVSQDVLIKALSGPKRSGQVLRAWLAAVTFNAAKNEKRSHWRRLARETKYALQEDGMREPEPLEIVQSHREMTYVIESLPPKLREVIVLRFYRKQSFKQISTTLGIEPGAARVRLHRALHQMRESMQVSRKDWRATCLILAPQEGNPSPPIPEVGSSTVQKLLLLASAIALLSTLGWWQFGKESERQNENPELASLEHLLAAQEEDSAAFQATPKVARVNQGVNPESAIVRGSAVEKMTRFGRVFYLGNAVVGAEVSIWQRGVIEKTVSQADGTFAFKVAVNANASLHVTANGMARSVRVNTGKRDAGIIFVHLLDPPEAEIPIFVRDGETFQPIPGAEVEIFLDYSGDRSNGPTLSGDSLEFVANGITDAEGIFLVPAWTADSLLTGRGQADGYAFNECVLRNSGDPRVIELFRGKELPVQLVFLDGSPVGDIELRQGSRVREVQRTTANGFLPNVAGWRNTVGTNKVRVLPDFLFLRLAKDRVWSQFSFEIEDDHIEVLEDRIRITVDDTPYKVKLEDVTLPEGFWVEARSINPYYAEVFEDQGDSFWQKIAIGETVSLEKGWTGEYRSVQARLMPGKIPMGRHKVEDGLAIIRLDIHPVKVVLEGPSVDSGEELVLVPKMVYPDHYSLRIPFEKGTAELFLDNKGQWSVFVERVSNGERLILENEWTQQSDSHSLLEIETTAVHYLREVASHTESVLIRMNGEPVLGGRVNLLPIGLDGRCSLPLNDKNLPLINQVWLELPADLHRQVGGPILCGFSVFKNHPLPGTIQRASNGQLVWDMEIALIEILAPASDYPNSDFGIPVHSPFGHLFSRLQWPYSRPEPGMFSTPLFGASPKGGWTSFRVPAGRYGFKITNTTYGGANGVDCPAGQITQFYPDESPD